MRLSTGGRHAVICAVAASVRGSAALSRLRAPIWTSPLPLLRHAHPFACEAAPAAQSLFPALNGWLSKALDAEDRKRASLQKEAEQAKRAEDLGKWATLVVSNLYRIEPSATSVTVEDWENEGKPVVITLEPTKGTAQAQADEAFTKARKLRRGSKVVEELIAASSGTSAQLSAWRSAVDEGADDEEALRRVRAEILKKAKALRLKVESLRAPPGGVAAVSAEGKAREKGGQKAKGSVTKGSTSRPRGKQPWTGRTLESPAGIPILVGRNRRENELLSLVIARDPDVWMHVRGTPGAHVVLRVSQAGRRVPTDECMQMAADLAAFYSDMRDERKAEVTYTSPKHVTKPPRSPLGAVSLRREDGMWLGRPSDVPQELKEARERFDSQHSD